MKLYKDNEDGQCFRTYRNLLQKNEKRLKYDLLDKDLNITIQPLNVDNSLDIDIGPVLGQLSEGIMEFISIFFNIQTQQIKMLDKYRLSDQEFQRFTREGEEVDARQFYRQIDTDKIITRLVELKKNGSNEFKVGLTISDLYSSLWKDNRYVFNDSYEKTSICSLARLLYSG